MDVADKTEPLVRSTDQTLIDHVERRRANPEGGRRRLPARTPRSFATLLTLLEREAQQAARGALQPQPSPADLALASNLALLVKVLRIVEVDTRDGDPLTTMLRARVKRAVASALSR